MHPGRAFVIASACIRLVDLVKTAYLEGFLLNVQKRLVSAATSIQKRQKRHKPGILLLPPITYRKVFTSKRGCMKG